MVYHLLVVVVIVSHVALLPGGRLLVYILLENDIYQQVSSSQTGHSLGSDSAEGSVDTLPSA